MLIRKVLATALGAATLLFAACGPQVVFTDPVAETTGMIGSTGMGTGVDSSPPVGDTTGAPNTTDSSADESSVDSSFITNNDGAGGWECSLWAQDCPPGEKCNWWANDGGGSWNATRCSPIARDPGLPGDPCTVEGSGTSGIDDCALGGMCWAVDPRTNTGICHALCTGSESEPECDDPGSDCSISGSGFALCLPSCDPLAQDCPRGQGCYGGYQSWTCSPDASGKTGGYGDPCEFINACDPGFACVEAARMFECAGSTGCCTDLCALSIPICLGADNGETCLPWDDDPAPSYENVGLCVLPR